MILDAEVVGIDRSTGRLRAFQDLASRPRGGVNEAEPREGQPSTSSCLRLISCGSVTKGVTNSPTGTPLRCTTCL